MGHCAELVSKWFDRVWVNGDIDYIEQGLAEKCYLTGLTPEPIESPAQFHEFHESLCSVFRGFNIKLDQIIEDGDTFAGVVSVEVTHIPSNRLIKFKSSFFGTMRNGQIHEVTNLLEYLTILEQIGAITPGFALKGLAGDTAL